MRLKNKDIAAMLGISPTAVSLAINGRPGVSDETRRKVLELVNESSLQALDGLAGPGRSGSIVFVVHKATGDVINDNPFFSNLIEVVQQAALARGFSVTIAHYVPGQSLDEHLAYVAGLGCDGMLLEATELDEPTLARYLELGVPTVLVDGYFDLLPVDAVTLDDQAAMLRAVAHAVQMGHEHIGFLAGVPRIKNFEHHLDGFWKGVRDFGIEGACHPVVELPCQIDASYEAMSAFLAKPPRGFKMPTCFVADLDNIALGAMRALQDAGYDVPGDVSVIGYGDTSIAAIANPPLTTTHINLYDSGRLAVERLADKMSRPPTATATTSFVASHLVERASVLDIRAAS